MQAASKSCERERADAAKNRTPRRSVAEPTPALKNEIQLGPPPVRQLVHLPLRAFLGLGEFTPIEPRRFGVAEMVLLVVVHDRPLRALPVEFQERVLVLDGRVRHRQTLALAHDVLAEG
eukprot:CAMPEP_0194277854 /NCGR_PEP_ID=MMETSP0169-20130528/10063_1 /TAXON_ID=218684 /ORGANISM="Corethron pennatum, Strain L29A3" /LENGTH=118 /DNA_ID=CAMNT_0039021915 /DNA_START=339 /DNA_END=691 /DNA_ORIENTATION=-